VHRSRTAPAAALCVAVLTGGACGSNHGASFAPDGGAADAGTSFDGGPPSVDAPTFGDASFTGDGGGTGDEVFVESPDTLYRLDPDTKAVSVVGPFSGCSQVTDIALDEASNMYATTLDGFYAVDRTSAACTRIASGTYPNSLSFVPAGTLDPNVEALVGYLGDTYVRIDLQSGAITSFASIGQGYTSSGDLVSVKGGGTYVAVKGGPDSCNDCLIQVDPATGEFLMEWGPVNHTGVFGLAFWGGAVYGADDQGDLFEIDFHGLAMQFTAIPVPSAPAGLQFWGAGTTTVAPLTPR
jgi:hypothetical protein